MCGIMFSLILTSITLSVGLVGCFLDLDELKNVYYGIDISDTPLLHPSELPLDAVILSSKYGQLYQCTYPPAPSQASTTENESQANAVSVAELLNPMKQLPCLLSSKGWWTYEFCYGREVKQYHVEDGKAVGDVIILGVYDNHNDVTNASEKIGDKRQKSVERYHSHYYVNGTLCDLTDRKRETEVRFMCREGHGDFVSSVDERHTCSYVVTVHTSRLCSHPLFAPPPTVKSLPISCNPLLSPVDYEMYLKEFPAGVVNKDDAAASDDSQQMTKAEESKAVQKLLIESMLKSVQTALKQQQQQTDQQSEASSETSLPTAESDVVTSQSSSNDDVVVDGVEKMKDAETDAASQSSADKHVTDNSDTSSHTDRSAATQSSADKHVTDNSDTSSHTDSEASPDDNDETTADTDDDDDADDDESRVDDDNDENEDYMREFENEVKDIVSTAIQRARLAKYRDSIASAMQAQFGNILHEARDDMAQQGEEPAAIDRDHAYNNLGKTLNLLLERLEKMKTDGVHKKADGSGSVDSGTEATTTDDADTMKTNSDDDDDDEHSSDNADDSSSEKKLHEQDAAGSESSELADDVASKEHGDASEKADKEIPSSQETLRDRLEKAGIDTRNRKLDLKIISAGNTEFRLLSDEDDSQTGRVFIAIIGDDDDAVKEKQRNQRLEDNYRFKWKKSEDDGV